MTSRSWVPSHFGTSEPNTPKMTWNIKKVKKKKKKNKKQQQKKKKTQLIYTPELPPETEISLSFSLWLAVFQVNDHFETRLEVHWMTPNDLED